MEEKLARLNDYLIKNCLNYLSLQIYGSIATGDPWQEGYSDYDVRLIFSRFSEEDFKKVKSYLDKSDLDDTWTFSIKTKEEFVASRDDSHDFNDKFRTKTLFGEDFVKDKELPNKEITYKIYTQGLKNVGEALDRRVLNSGFWSERRVRGVFRNYFKEALMYLAIKHWYETGIYPKTRLELVTMLNLDSLKKVLELYNNVEEKDKNEIVASGLELSKLILHI